jgi:hypothetical protein
VGFPSSVVLDAERLAADKGEVIGKAGMGDREILREQRASVHPRGMKIDNLLSSLL